MSDKFNKENLNDFLKKPFTEINKEKLSKYYENYFQNLYNEILNKERKVYEKTEMKPYIKDDNEGEKVKKPIDILLNNFENINLNNIIYLSKVSFVIKCDTKNSGNIGILGDLDIFCNWNTNDINKIYKLKWNEGNIWKNSINNEKENIKDIIFKFIILNNNNNIIWQKEENINVNFSELYNEVKKNKKGNYQNYKYEYINKELILIFENITFEGYNVQKMEENEIINNNNQSNNNEICINKNNIVTNNDEKKINDEIFFKNITFVIKCDTKKSGNIGILGDLDIFCNWNTNDINKIYKLKWNEGNIWKNSINNEKENIKDIIFKFIILNNNNNIIWQKEENINVNFSELYNEVKKNKKGNYQNYKYEYINKELILIFENINF